MKDYNFMISDDRLHKTRFCKKKVGLTKTFLIKRGVGAKGGLERFRILRGALTKKAGFFIPWCPLPGLRQFLATESPLKMMQNVFYFTLKVTTATKQ